jgi:hypothetical protein
MQTKTRMNVYFEPGLLKQVEALAAARPIPAALSSRLRISVR